MDAENRGQIPKKLSRGWRRSLRNESLYRRKGGWVAIIKPDGHGYRLILLRTAPTFEDALVQGNEIMEIGQ